jgi:hypothetical protein
MSSENLETLHNYRNSDSTGHIGLDERFLRFKAVVEAVTDAKDGTETFPKFLPKWTERIGPREGKEGSQGRECLKLYSAL